MALWELIERLRALYNTITLSWQCMNDHRYTVCSSDPVSRQCSHERIEVRFLRYHVFSQNLNFCQQTIHQVFFRKKLYLLSTILINSMSHDSETPRLIPNGPVSAQNGPIEETCKFRIFRRSGWRCRLIHDICVFLSTKILIK